MSDSRYAIPTAGFSLTLQIKISNKVGEFARFLNLVAEAGGLLGEVKLLASEFAYFIRSVTINAKSEAAAQEILEVIKKSNSVEVLDVKDDTLEIHKAGKLNITSKCAIENADDLSRAYTPGVARVCKMIHEDKALAYDYTIKNNCIAVVSDGTAVLGLGDIGPEAAMPVMEGKAVLFKEFAGLNSFPVCLATKDVEEIIATVKYMAPSFGGINLEDISAPRCFEIEKRLDEELDIPVFHDDQHGTAVVVLAGVINACKVLNRKIEDLKVVVNGFGSSGVACIKIMLEAGIKNIIACDTAGIAYRGRKERMNDIKLEMVEVTNPDNLKGNLADALKGADMFLGVSQPGVVTRDDIAQMNKQPIIFTLANPVPEIFPDEINDLAGVIATGRSDYPNQVNNVLCFPGLMLGALQCRARCVTMGMKLEAAYAIANIISDERLNKDLIIPRVFNREVAYKVAEAVKAQAIKEGVAQIIDPNDS